MHLKLSAYFVIARAGVGLAEIFPALGSFPWCWGTALLRQPSGKATHLLSHPAPKKSQYSQGVSIRLQSVSLWGMLLQKPITINKYNKTGKKSIINRCALITNICNNSLLFYATRSFHLLPLHSVNLIFPFAVLLSKMIKHLPGPGKYTN